MNITITSRSRQRGVTLFVSLVLLVLITLMVTTAFTLSNTNLKSVGNMQTRNEAISAANKAIEQVISSSFTTTPAAEVINVDINNDSTTDYIVSIATPVCIRSSIDAPSNLSSVTLPITMTSSSSWNTLWEIEAVVNDALTGAKTTVRSGTRVLLTQAQKNAVCS
jgi:Tfp pilus assembly protein PilX